jgi:hypothetical protein
MKRMPPFVLAITLLAAPQIGADEPMNIAPLVDGGRAPRSVVAHFVSGPLATPEPRSACPVLKNRKSPKIAVYTRDATPGVIKLAKAVDQIIAGKPELKWSFLFVSHENAPRPSEEQFKTQLAKLKRIASDEQISHLSIGLLERGPELGEKVLRKQSLGFLKEDQTAIALIYRSPDPKMRSFLMTGVQYASSDKLTTESIDQLITKLKASLAKVEGDFPGTE